MKCYNHSGKNMNKLVKFLLKIYAKFIKKSHEYIIFESAREFYDNAYALYLYIKKNYPQYKLKYVVTTREMRKSGKYRGVSKKEMINVKNKLQLYKYSLKAKVIFFSYTNYWRKLKLQDDTRIVYTAHGEFPLKNCEAYYDFIFGPQENIIDITIRTEYSQKVLTERYPIFKNHRTVVLGMPRSDFMFNSKVTKEDFLKSIGVKDYEGKKVILSMTTFRNAHAKIDDYFKDEYSLSLTREDVNEIDDLLGRNNQVLLVKLHHSQDGVVIPKGFKNIYFLNNTILSSLDVSINELYSVTDSLLTDFSSSYMSFLSLDRKEGFILADKEKYTIDRGYSFANLEDVLPGQKIYSKEDLISYFNNVNSPDDPYKEDRRRIKLMLTGDYKDQNCKSFTDYYLKEKEQ